MTAVVAASRLVPTGFRLGAIMAPLSRFSARSEFKGRAGLSEGACGLVYSSLRQQNHCSHSSSALLLQRFSNTAGANCLDVARTPSARRTQVACNGCEK